MTNTNIQPISEEWLEKIEKIVHMIYMDEDLIGGAKEISHLLSEAKREAMREGLKMAVIEGDKQYEQQQESDYYKSLGYIEKQAYLAGVEHTTQAIDQSLKSLNELKSK